jgi:hypothetical protein
MKFLRAGQAVKFGAPEKSFWLTEAPYYHLYFDTAKVRNFQQFSKRFPNYFC